MKKFPDINWLIITDIVFRLIKEFCDIIKSLIKASILGFWNIGENKILKKNIPIKEFFCVVVISGNFLFIKIEIILQKHYSE